MINDKCIERRVARDILNIIEKICFSEEYKEFRNGMGSNGQRDLILKEIKDTYNVG